MDIQGLINGETYNAPNPNYDNKTKKLGVPKFIPTTDPRFDITQSLVNSAIRTPLNEEIKMPYSAEDLAEYGLTPTNVTDDITKDLAEKQSAFNKLFHGIERAVISEVGIGTFKGVSDLVDAIGQGIGVSDGDYTNPVSQYLAGLQKDFEELTPIYYDQSKNISNGGLIDAGWWASNIPSIASSLTLLIPSTGIVKGLGTLGKLSSLQRFGNNAVKWMRGTKNLKGLASSKNIDRFNRFVENGTTAALSRVMENYQEAQQVHEDIKNNAITSINEMSDKEYQKLVNRNADILEGVDINDKEAVANAIAHEAATETFKDDFLNIGFDIIQLYGLRNTWKGLRKAHGSSSLELANQRIIRNAGKTADEIAKLDAAKGFIGKRLEQLKAITKGGYKTALSESTEGIEEAINYIAQQEGTHLGQYLIDGKDASGIDSRIVDYITAPQLWDSAFWGVLGGVVFQGLGSSFKRLEQKIGEGLSKKDETVEGVKKKSWWQFDDLPEIKRRKSNIEYQGSRLETLFKEVEEINAGRNPYAKAGSSNEDKTFATDTEEGKLQQEIARENAINSFIDDVIMNSANNGNIDYLRTFLESDEVREAMVKKGVISENEATTRQKELVDRIDEIENMFEQEVNQLNDVASSSDYNIPIEYLQIIANNNVRGKLAIQQYKKVAARFEEKVKATEDLVKEQLGSNEQGKPNMYRQLVDLQNKAQELSTLYADKKRIENDKNLSKSLSGRVQIDEINKKIKTLEKELFDDTTSYNLGTSLFVRSIAPRAIWNEDDTLGFDNSKKSIEALDQILAGNFDEFLKEFGSTKKSSDFNPEEVRQRINVLTKDIERVTGKDSELDNINPTLKSTYQQLSAINTAILYEQSRLTHTVEDVTHYANTLHNTMVEARNKAINQAVETIKQIADKYPNIMFGQAVDNVDNQEKLNELIQTLSVEDKNKFMEQLEILDLTKDVNRELGVEVANILTNHQFKKLIEDAADIEENGEKEGEKTTVSEKPDIEGLTPPADNNSEQQQEKPQQDENALNEDKNDKSQQDKTQQSSSTNSNPTDAFVIGDVITGENYDADGNVVSSWNKTITEVFPNGGIKVDDGTEYSPKMVREFFGLEKPFTQGAHSKIVNNSRLGNATPYKPTNSSTGGQELHLPSHDINTKSISVDDTDSEINKAALAFFKEHITNNTEIIEEEYNKYISSIIGLCEDESYAKTLAKEQFNDFVSVLKENDDKSHLVKDVVLNSSSLSESSNPFTEAYKKAIDNLLKAYVKAAGISKIKGVYNISLEHLLKYCNSLASKDTNAPANLIFKQLRDYLIKDKPKGYEVYDLNEATDEDFLDKVKESVATRVERAKDNGMQRVGIRSYIDYLENIGVPEEEINKVIEEIDKIIVGDALTYDISSGNIITIKHNGIGIGSLLIPRVANSNDRALNIEADALVGETGGWNYDIIKRGDKIHSVFGNEIIKILNSNTEEAKQIIKVLRDISTPNLSTADKFDIVDKLKGNQLWLELRRNFSTPKSTDLICAKSLSNIFVYGELANSISSPSERKTAIDSFNQWLSYLNNSYEQARYLVDNPETKIEVAAKFKGEQNRLSKEEAKPVNDKNVIADKYKGRIRIGVSEGDYKTISVSSSDEIPAKVNYDTVHPGSTFVVIPDGNGNHTYVHAFPAKLSDGYVSNTIKTIKNEIHYTILKSLKELYKVINSNSYNQQDYINAMKPARELLIKLLDNNINGAYGNLNNPLLLGLRVNRKDNYRINIFKRNGEQFSLSVDQTGHMKLEINGNSNYVLSRTTPEELTKYIMGMIERNTCFNIGYDYVKSDNNASIRLAGVATRTKEGKFQIKIGDFAPHEFNSFNDFMLENNLVKVTTYVGSNGDNFKLVGDRSQLTNGTVHYKISGQEFSVNPPVEEIKNKSTRPRTKGEKVIEFINNNESFTGQQIAEMLLGKQSNVLKDLVDKGLLPKQVSFDRTVTDNAIVARKSGRVKLGLGFIEILNNGDYRQAVRKLVHERLHNLIETNGETDFIRKQIREIYDAFVASNPNSELQQYIDWNKQERYWDAENNTLTDEGIEEFFVESITSGELARYLNSVQSTKESKYSEVKEENKSLWQKIIDVLLKLLGKGNTKLNIKDNTLFAQEMLLLSEEINNIENKDNNQEIKEEQKDEDDEDNIDDYLDLSSLSEKHIVSELDKELDDIKEKAIANGTFMKAPNGNPTNLNERQWLQVRTKAFKEWFGDWENNPERASKVVDENGEPLIVYHGTDDTWNVFDPTLNIRQKYGNGLYTTTRSDVSNHGRITMPLFLNIRKPLEGEPLTKEYKEEGFDGVIVPHSSRLGTWYVAPNPNQIKSATDNNGDFSTENDDINHSSLKEHKTSNSSVRSIIEKLPVENQANMLKLKKEGVINMRCK